MVSYELITPVMRYGNRVVGKIESLTLDDYGIHRSGKMSCRLDCCILEGLYREKLLPFSIKDQKNKPKHSLNKEELLQLLENLTIETVPMVTEHMQIVVLDINNINMDAHPNQTASLQNQSYILNNFLFNCDLRVHQK